MTALIQRVPTLLADLHLQTPDTTSGAETKDIFFQWAKQKQVLDSEAWKIWTLLQPLLPASCDQQSVSWLRSLCGKMLSVPQNKRVEVLTNAVPLMSLCITAEHKLLVLITLFRIPEHLRKPVVEVIPFAFQENIRKGLGIAEEFVMLCAAPEPYLEERLQQWLDKNPTAKDRFLTLANENGVSESETKEIWKMLQPSLPHPWNHDLDFNLEMLCQEIFKIESDKREEVLTTIRPLCDFCSTGEQKLMVLTSVLRVPQHLRKTVVEIAIFNAKNDKTNEGIGFGFCMACSMPEKELEKWLEDSLKIKERIENLTIHLTKEDKGIEQQIAGQFGALQGYQPGNRSPNSTHLKLYGGEAVQDKFRQGQRKSLNFALYTNQLNKISTDTVNDLKRYREHLEGLGARRMRTALLCETEEWDQFGWPNLSGMMVNLDGFKKVYGQYAEQIIKHGSNSIEIDGISYLLTAIDGQYFHYCYEGFWNNDDPLFLYMANLYKQLTQNETLAGDALRVAISDYHWTMVNGLFWQKGTAANAETSVDAMWIGHNYNPPEGEEAKCLDLRALAMTKEEFAKIYPMGEKIKKLS